MLLPKDMPARSNVFPTEDRRDQFRRSFVSVSYFQPVLHLRDPIDGARELDCAIPKRRRVDGAGERDRGVLALHDDGLGLQPRIGGDGPPAPCVRARSPRRLVPRRRRRRRSSPRPAPKRAPTGALNSRRDGSRTLPVAPLPLSARQRAFWRSSRSWFLACLDAMLDAMLDVIEC